jgi:hypothetical protein
LAAWHSITTLSPGAKSWLPPTAPGRRGLDRTAAAPARRVQHIVTSPGPPSVDADVTVSIAVVS